jgi:sialic acid synthase SpsE
MAQAADRGIMFLSTPFDEASARFLHRLGVPAFKIASGEITNLPFLRLVAMFRRPIILSTGMSTMDEVAAAVRVIRRSGNPPLALLHCVSCYPAEHRDLNLRAIHTLATRFKVPVGYSDHSRGLSAPVAAVALGASIIEKHLTLDRTLPGPDHAASLEPSEFAAMVKSIREVEQALGSGAKKPARAEQEIARVARRSLVTAAPIARGERITAEKLACKRPGTGLPPSEYGRVLGRRAARALPIDHLIRRSDLA